MVITINKNELRGGVVIPPSKSVAHRALICAAVRGKKTRIRCTELSEDIEATMRCLRSLGYDVDREGEFIDVGATRKDVSSPTLDCGESGSTFRFVLPLAAALGCDATFVGAGRLGKRPMDELYSELERHGIVIEHPQGSSLPCTISGKCKGGSFYIRGDISSQYITGLLLAFPLMEECRLGIVGRIESKPYIDITIDVLKNFGYSVIDEGGVFVYNGYNENSIEEYTVEGDYSNGAFFVVGGLIGAKDGLEIFGLSRETKQGDKAIIDIMTRFGGSIDEVGDSLIVHSSSLHGTAVNVSDTPDLAPIIAVAAAAAHGRTVIDGCARLRAKESDRIESTLALINGLGGMACSDGDKIIVEGSGRLRGGKVSSYGDHRIAMSAAIASLICDGDVIIDGAEAVAKSFPRFFELLDSLS